MTLEIDLDTATMEELEYFKNIIELKIGEKELAQERLRDREMVKTYRTCLIENLKILISCNPRIKDGEKGLKACIKDFMKSNDKHQWLRENFLIKLECILCEICYQYSYRHHLLDRKETIFLLGEFLRALEKLEVEE